MKTAAERQARYRANHPDRVKASNAKYYLAHRKPTPKKAPAKAADPAAHEPPSEREVAYCTRLKAFFEQQGTVLDKEYRERFRRAGLI